jgi:hypothetical protein
MLEQTIDNLKTLQGNIDQEKNVDSYGKWLCDYWLTPTLQFHSYNMARTS